MKIGIIGGGSIGLLVSAYLARTHHVTLYVRRKEQQMKIKENGLQLFKSSTVERKVCLSVKLITELQEEDLLFVSVKQAHLLNVIHYLHKTDTNTQVVFLQNGMSHISLMKQLRQPSYVGVVEHGAYRMNDNSVDHLGEGVIKLASVTSDSDKLQHLAEVLDYDAFPFERMADWSELLKSKLIINAVINPLTTLFDVPNGHVITNPHIQVLAKNVCAEIASSLSLNVDKSWKSIVKTAKNTSENMSSMRADIKFNRPSEIEAIIGYVLHNKGHRQLPYTTFVYHAILSLSYREGIHDERTTNG